MTLIKLIQTKLNYTTATIMRLLKQGAIKVNGVPILNNNLEIDLSKKLTIKIGKTKKFEL